MNKLIIGVVMISLTVAGTFLYFYFDQEELLLEEDNSSLKIEPTNNSPVENTPSKILEVDYMELERGCKVTKCTIEGCFCQ